MQLVSAPRLLKDAKAQKEFEKACQDFNADFWLPLSPEIRKIFNTFSITEEQILPLLAFLLRHKFLIPILSEAPEHIRDIFGYETKLSLDLDRDPEGKFEELFVVVKTMGSTEEAIDLLGKLDEVWFLKVLPKTRNQLNITIEIQGKTR